ncbi:MAG: flagellar export chaperone FliS [Pseudomonadales bacterium]|nr:flagellar export chaperone FliS [Pseudomonadales bacterium]
MAMGYNRGINAYNQIGKQSAIEYASPHQLIQMLFDGAIENLNLAKAHAGRGEVAEKAKAINKTSKIIDGLRMSLDTSVDHEITRNLENLYDYMSRRLLLANLNSDVAIMSEVVSLLEEISDAWRAVPEEFKNPKKAEI